MRLDLRFSLAEAGYSNAMDSPAHKAVFDEINSALWHRREAIDDLWNSLSEQNADALSVMENDKFSQVYYRVLKQLDDEGVFGHGAAREAITVIATNGDQDLDPSTFGDVIRDLNPPSVYEHYIAFRRAWLELLERFQAQQRQRRSGRP
jgi:hypothetical protein